MKNEKEKIMITKDVNQYWYLENSEEKNKLMIYFLSEAKKYELEVKELSKRLENVRNLEQKMRDLAKSSGRLLSEEQLILNVNDPEFINSFKRKNCIKRGLLNWVYLCNGDKFSLLIAAFYTVAEGDHFVAKYKIAFPQSRIYCSTQQSRDIANCSSNG